MADSTREMKSDNFSSFKTWVRNGLRSKGEYGKKAETALDGLNRGDFENFGDWCLEGNYYGFYDESERDEKKVGWTADRAANELAVTTIGGVAATTLGAALLPIFPLLGICVIFFGNIPRPVFNKLREWVNSETFGLAPVDGLPSPTAEFSNFAHSTDKRVTESIERLKSAVAGVEEALRQQEARESGQGAKSAKRGSKVSEAGEKAKKIRESRGASAGVRVY